MGWSEGFIAADWGTTNRRGYRIGADGALQDEMEDDSGILSVPAGGFGAAVAELRARLGDLPLLLAGMVGSNRGWIEAPYVRCPAGIDDLAAAVVWAEPGCTAIVPGVAWDEGDAADVMRGEEVQIVGAVADGLIPPDCIVCHPGTHNKWVLIEGGRIAAFRTVMTGELFSLLKSHSILADLLALPADTGTAFEAGVRRGLECETLAAELFSIRARTLLGKSAREDAASFASGLLIGNDVKLGLAFAGERPIAVMGRPELTELFCAALRIAARETSEVDGETAFLAGIRHIAGRLK